MLKDGGMLFVNTFNKNQPTGIETFAGSETMGVECYVAQGFGTVQKGFSDVELNAYVTDVLHQTSGADYEYKKSSLGSRAGWFTKRGAGISYQEYINQSSGALYSTRFDVVDVNGKEYDSVVVLDKKISVRELNDNKKFFSWIEKNLIGARIRVYDQNLNTEVIEFAKADETVKKDGAKNPHPVIGELAYAKGDVKRRVIANSKEAIKVSVYDSQHSSNDNAHDWLDRNGWEGRSVYVMDPNTNKVYPANLRIAKAEDGRNILYAVNCNIDDGVAVDQEATRRRAAVLAATPSEGIIADSSSTVKLNSSRHPQDIQTAIENYRAQRDAEAKAMKAVYEADRAQIIQSYNRQMDELQSQADGQIAAAHTRFAVSSKSEYRAAEKIPAWVIHTPERIQIFIGSVRSCLQ